MADNTRRTLHFEDGGRPYNNTDFNAIQNSINDAQTFLNSIINKNGVLKNNTTLYNKSVWILDGFKNNSGDYTLGESGLIWLDGKIRYVEYRDFSNINEDAYIEAINSEESRLYKDGNVKKVFNVYSAKWLLLSELDTNNVHAKFSSTSDIANSVLDESAYLKSIIARQSSTSTSVIPLTGNITFEGRNGFKVYRDDNNVKKLVLEQADPEEFVHPPIQNYWQPFTVTVSAGKIISSISVTPDDRCAPNCGQGHIESFSVSTDNFKLSNSNRAVTTGSDGSLTTSAVTATELGYLDGVTSSIQDQLDDKLNLTGGKINGDLVVTGDLFVDGTIKSNDDIIAFAGESIPSLINNNTQTAQVQTNWENLTGFTSEYESDQYNVAQYRIDSSGNVHLKGIVKRKVGKIISDELFIVFPNELNPSTNIDSVFNVASVELKEFTYINIKFDGTNFTGAIKIMNKNTNEESDYTTAIYLDGIIYNKII